jgi:hypothetical protein
LNDTSEKLPQGKTYACHLTALRGRGESYSDVILRIVGLEARVDAG